jgi:type IV pilus assembly protein PilA
MKKQSGFTLIELLLVLAIIGIISAIAIPALLGQRARSRDKSVIANANGVVSDMVAGYDKCKDAGTIPTVANFIASICGTSGTPLVPQWFSAPNPWNSSNQGYNQTIATETSPLGTATNTAATTLGQVVVGYMPPATGASGAIAAAGLVNTSFKNAAGNSVSIFTNVAGVD